MKKLLLLIYILYLAGTLFSQTDTTSINDANQIKFQWDWIIFSFCLLGCILQEVIYWFELRRNITQNQKSGKLNSFQYWIITIIATLVFSVASCFYFVYGEQDANFFTIIVISAGFPRIFKSAVQQATSPPTETETTVRKRQFSLSDYLMV